MGGVLLEIRNISKNYGVVQALDGVTFDIEEGEVHSLLGENGAGKSTLIKIISGEETPTSGEIAIGGTTVTEYSPRRAMQSGIAMVHQELAIFENMTVAENIFPGIPFRKWPGFIDKQRMNAEAAERIRMFGMDISASQRMDELTMAQHQMVEILRCLSLGTGIILLDEPTSGLNIEEADKLMGIIRSLKEKGITVIYISHRINEVLNVSDRISVMRNGRYIGTYKKDAVGDEAFLIGKMVGREIKESMYITRAASAATDDIVFEAKNLTKRKSVQDVSFALKHGEILGFFGLEGSGTGALSRIIFGLDRLDSGELSFRGERLTRPNPSDMTERRITYLNNNRKSAGLLLRSPVSDNMAVPVLSDLTKGIFIDRGKVVDYAVRYIREFDIMVNSIWQKPMNLSGGNQQKLMFSMCLEKQPEILILNEPTRGVDVGAKYEIHRFMADLAGKGVSIMLFSSEMPELINLADRIIVMHENRVTAEIKRGAYSEENILTAASGY